MFERYLPKKFCREFVELKGSGQLAMIMAVVIGIKPCMDDWIRIDRLKEYRRACKRYGLLLKEDAVFDIVRQEDIPKNVVGKNRLTTTRSFGRMYNNSLEKGLVHVFISRKKSWLEACFKDGWYPLIINGRVIDRPVIDAFKFGYSLGYPGCCVDFFHRYNNWNRYSFLYQALINTSGSGYNFLCNPLAKDFTYSYVYHMPCSYNCRSTVQLTGELRKEINENEPGFVKEIDRHLQLPFLVFYEGKIYAFEGQIKKGKLCYKKVYFLGIMPENNLYEDILKKGDSLFLEGRDVIILKNGKKSGVIKNKENGFAPEIPFLIQFSGQSQGLRSGKLKDTGLPLKEKSLQGIFNSFVRETNRISDEIERKDPYFTQLAVKYCANPADFKRLSDELAFWPAKHRRETDMAFSGYSYYILGDYLRAKKEFLRAIFLNPDNLDNWIDLAFALRHAGEDALSKGIIFNLAYIIYYYKYLKLDASDYPQMKKMIIKVTLCSGNGRNPISTV